MADIIQTTTLRDNLASVLETIEKKKRYLLVSNRGRLVSALVNLDLFEDLLALASPKYLASIKKAREQIKKGEYFTHGQVFGELK